MHFCVQSVQQRSQQEHEKCNIDYDCNVSEEGEEVHGGSGGGRLDAEQQLPSKESDKRDN